MDDQQCFYSLVQYIPDPRRAEAVNVGIVVYSVTDKSTEVAFTNNFAHLKRSFNLDDAQLTEAKRRIHAFEVCAKSAEFQFANEAAFQSYAATRANAVRLTAPRFVSCKNPHALVQELLQTLVDRDCDCFNTPKGKLDKTLNGVIIDGGKAVPPKYEDLDNE